MILEFLKKYATYATYKETPTGLV